MPKSKSPNAANPAGSPAIKADEAEFKRNLTRYRNWLSAKSVHRAVRMVLPSYYDGNSQKLKTIVDDSLQPCTDGKNVWVSLLPDALKDVYPESTWQILIFVALCHEIQHGNSSNFNDIVAVEEWFQKYVKDNNLPISDRTAAGIAKEFLNIVEDGRIEAIAVVRWPGMFSGFRLLNEIIRDGTAIKEQALLPNAEFEDFKGNVLSYAKTGLYAPGVEAYAGSEMEAEFLKIKPFVDEGVSAKTSQGCREAVQKLLAASAEYIAKLCEKSEALQQMLQSLASQNPEYTQNNETMYNDNPQPCGQGGTPLRSKSPVKGDQSNSDSGDSDDQDGDGSGSSGSGKPKKSKKSDQSQGSSKSKKSSKTKKSGKNGGSDKDSQDDQSGKGSEDSKDDGAGKDGEDSAADEDGQDGKNSKDGQGSQDGQSDQDEKASQGNQDGESGKDSQNSQNGQEGRGSDGSDSDSSSAQRGRANTQSPMSFCNAESDAVPLTQAEMDELVQLAGQTFSAAEAIEAEANRATNDGLDDKAITAISSSYGTSRYNIVQEAMVIPEDKPLPPEQAKQSSDLRREIERVQVKKQRSQRGLRNGMLDVNALWKIGVREDTIFARRRNPQAGSCAFYILIDNSGSTTEEAYTVGRRTVCKFEAERTAAGVIESAAAGLVPCKVVLFDQSRGVVNHQIIRTFDEKSKKIRSWNSLTSVPTGGCNADSVHIRIAAEELRRRPEQKKVLFILSDGMPSAYGSRQQAEDEVNAAVMDARRKGIIIIPIMFGTQNFLNTTRATYMKMYVKDVIACVPQKITAELIRLFRLLIAR